METKTVNQITLDTIVQTEERSLIVDQQSEQTELPKDTVTEINGVPVTTSLKIAEVFGKSHDNVLKAIRKAEKTVPDEGKINGVKINGVENPFVQATYKDAKGEERSMYYLTEAGLITANPDIWEQVRGVIKTARDNWDTAGE